MTIQQAIEKAIEGGYDVLTEWPKFQIVIGGVGLYEEGENFVKRIGAGTLIPRERILLDPDFWRALGKSMGWDQPYEGDDYRVDNKYEYRNRWLGLIWHLDRGGTIESFFETL